jgi:ketosteroid isomerase-like protein
MTKAVGALLLLPCAYLHGYDAATEAGQADKAYRQAMNAGNVVVLARLITDDFLFVRRTGEIWDKKGFLEIITARKLVADVQEKDLKTRIYGDTAIFTHMDSLKTTDGAMVEMIATRVFVKQRGSWKLASVQDTALPAR